MTSEKALIYLNAYAIRPPVPLLKASSLIYIITGPIQTPQYSLIISQVSIHIHMAYLFGPSILELCFLHRGRKKMESFKQMSSSKRRKKKKKKKRLCGVFLHLYQFQPMTSLIVILSITLISSSPLQQSLGTCDCTLSIRTKLLWLRSNCYLLNYILLLCTTQGRMRQRRMQLPFLTVNRLLPAKSNIPYSQNNHWNIAFVFICR